MLLQVFRKEVGELAEGDKACPVIQIHMPGSGDDIQFLRFRREPVRVFAELDGVRLFARDEQHGARGNRLDVRERVEVHELDVAGERRVRGELRGGAFRSEFPSRRPVECVEFPLDGRGRFRQFMQCDIDILGEPGNLAEIELILATTTMLGKMDFHNFTVCINDRNILKAMAAFSGFKEEDFDEVFIILDKMDKIGKEGVGEELVEMGYTKENVDTYLGLFDEINPDVDGIRFCKEKLAGFLDEKTADSMEMIISSVESAKEADFKVKFDPTLVRGQSYYTGTIFEVTMDEFGGSVAGGGRYDKMIGKFTGQDTPACGFSIGFERIVMLLLENGYEIPSKRQKKAYLLEKNMHKEGILKVLEMAKADRAAGKQVLVVNMKKNKKFQKDQLIAEGYEDITDCYKDSVMDL